MPKHKTRNTLLNNIISFANRRYASFFANTNGSGTSFKAPAIVKFFDGIFSFVI